MRYCCERVYHIHNLNEVPETFRTKELYKKYIECGGNLIDVPMNYITE